MVERKRLSQQESRLAALEAARLLLIEQGPQAITLKSVAARIGRTHANLLHHFGTAADLQRALAEYLAKSIIADLAHVVLSGKDVPRSARQVVDVIFDAFGKQGGAALASWMLLSGNADALEPVFDTIHDLVVRPDIMVTKSLREAAMSLALLAMGDALVGPALAKSFELDDQSVRDEGERLLLAAREKAKAELAVQPA